MIVAVGGERMPDAPPGTVTVVMIMGLDLLGGHGSSILAYSRN